MFQEEISPATVEQAAIENTQPGPGRKLAQFYADLYIALYFDSLDKSDEAERFLKRSLTHGSSGYMTDTARVYLTARFPDAVKTQKPTKS